MNYANQNGFTAMHICLENGLYNAVRMLLNSGANPHIMDLKGMDVCDKAGEAGVLQMFPKLQYC